MEPRQFEKKTQSELDDILNSALDELEDEDDFATMGMQGRDASKVPGGSVRKMEDEASVSTQCTYTCNMLCKA
jgi:hypothetical protein